MVAYILMTFSIINGCRFDYDVLHHAIYWLIPDFYPPPSSYISTKLHDSFSSYNGRPWGEGDSVRE